MLSIKQFKNRREYYKARSRLWREKHPGYDLKYMRQPGMREKAVERSKAWYLKNKTEYSARLKEQRERLKTEAIKAFGGKCVCCGTKQREFLTIDHIKGGGVKDRKRMNGRTWLTLKLEKYNKRLYRLLCMNCNFAKGVFGKCPHEKRK